jgi:hypothetical protein
MPIKCLILSPLRLIRLHFTPFVRECQWNCHFVGHYENRRMGGGPAHPTRGMASTFTQGALRQPLESGGLLW